MFIFVTWQKYEVRENFCYRNSREANHFEASDRYCSAQDTFQELKIKPSTGTIDSKTYPASSFVTK